MNVGNAIGVTRQNEVLLKWTSQQVHYKEVFALQYAEKEKFRTDAEERYLAYIFLKKSASTGDKLRNNLSND